MEKYLEDLAKRDTAAQCLIDKNNFSTVIRKELTLDALEGQMNELYDKNRLLRMSAKDREHELEIRNQAELHTQRVSKTVNKKLGFRKKKALKRASSYVPELEDFADIEDIDAIEEAGRRADREARFDRSMVNFQLGDVTEKRIVKDFLRSENEDVEGDHMEDSDIGLPRDMSTLTKGSKYSGKSTKTHWKDGSKKQYGDRNKSKQRQECQSQEEYDQSVS